MKHHELTLEHLARVAKSMGSDGFINLANSLPEVGAKHGDKTIGFVELILNMINPNDQERLRHGEASIKIIDVIKSLFDGTGRVIPPRGFKPSVVDEDRNFRLDSSIHDDKIILERLKEYLPQYKFLSLEEFQNRVGTAKEKALNHPLIGPNAFKRCHFPLPIPHIPELADIKNLGQVVETLLKSASRAYQDEFNDPPHRFINNREGTLVGQTQVVSGTRHGRLLKAASQAPQSGMFLPNPLQGYSIQADRDIIQLFPDFVFLAGIEYILAMIACPDVLARDWNTPGLDMAALQWQSADYSLHFRADGDRLDFGRTDYLAYANGRYSGGLLFLG